MTVYFIERLTVWSWLTSLVPYFMRRHAGAKPARPCYVFDGSRRAMWMARRFTRLTGVRVEPLRFRLIDVRDEEGRLVRLDIAYQDLADVQAQVMHDARVRGMTEQAEERSLPVYLAKALTSPSLTERGTLWRALFVIRVCRWALRSEREPSQAVLFAERRPWGQAIARYASRFGVVVVPVRSAPGLRAWLMSRLSFRTVQGIRMTCRLRSPRLIRRAFNQGSPVHERTPRVGVDYVGHLNLNRPELHSDLFFWQQSSLPARDVVMLFATPRDPLDEQKWAELRERGISAIALRPEATTSAHAPLYLPRFRSARDATDRSRPLAGANSLEARWLRAQRRDYRILKREWAEVCRAEGIKVHVTWYKQGPAHCAMTDAMAEVGGVSVIYQRSYEGPPSPEAAVAADLFFGFSPAGAEAARLSGSAIPYYVIVGYVGDHRFSLLRETAHRIRQSLSAHGAKRVLAFFDENSLDDPRWHTGHDPQREHYTFLLEQVLKHPWLGLVLKPKVPLTLRSRLGPVAALLERAQATGRCVLFDRGTIKGSYPPAAAALAADVAIHGHLWALTAGMEAALSGVPTLLLDGERWSRSPFHRLRLEMGQVVFEDWEGLWRACQEHWGHPGGMPGFGDWSAVLDELDPFRDGRAAQRMGTYLQWLLEGFKAGLSRETVMADAAQRYRSRWGGDTVREIGSPEARGSARETDVIEPAQVGG